MNTIKISALFGILLAIMPGPIVMQRDLAQVHQKELACLAKNIYHEARGEPLHGQIAVAQVTLNRLNSGSFGSSICEVVYQPYQFSWTLDKAKRVMDPKAWEASLLLAAAILDKRVKLPDFGALYFHTKQVKPKWRKTKQVLATIGNHIFYL